ncbi:hypothetical protein DFJ74DRAFT_655596 [Hyaloraphidium curvatum]|nr:hypothetical protein DFJ74DRAFT_655596 [Hyaloraphidium curvatum]
MLAPRISRQACSACFIRHVRLVAPRRSVSRSSIDTYRIVRSLEREKFTREQAVAIMQVLDELLVESSAAVRRQAVSRFELETSIYKFRSRLQDLRTELHMVRSKATSELRGEISELQAEIDSIGNRLNEAVGKLRFDMSVEHSNRKAEEAEEGKALEGKTLDLQQTLAVKLADLRTSAETMKMSSTRKLVLYAGGAIALTVGFDLLLPWIEAKLTPKPAPDPPREDLS